MTILNKHILLLPVIAIILLLVGCDDPDAFDCIKKSGETVEQEIAIQAFDRIFVEDDIFLEVAYGENQQVKVKGGKNLIPGVKFEFVGKDLTISNDNKCGWTRGYDPIIVQVITNDLREIESSGYGNIKSTNLLTFDVLAVESKDGSGDFDLNVDINRLRVVNNSISNITITGNANIMVVSHWYNDGKFDGQALSSRQIEVIHNGVNTIKIRPEDKLSGAINSRGNVLYFGNPSEVDVSISGDGKLIQQ